MKHKNIIAVIIGCLLLLAAVVVKGQSAITMKRKSLDTGWPELCVADTFSIDYELYVYGSVFSGIDHFDIPLSDSTVWRGKDICYRELKYSYSSHLLSCKFKTLDDTTLTILFYFHDSEVADAYWHVWDEKNNEGFTGGNPLLTYLDQ
jgi:hypothetical protein